ncbi:MAG: gephyrin-like molybdotransferase Glp [Candidatus Bathyarchaeia archaeon]
MSHKGFDNYTAVNNALEGFLSSYLKNGSFTPKKERVNLQDAVNRVLAEDFASPIDIPPFTRSAMDGYAVIASDLKGASPKNPVTLEVVGRAYAGDAAEFKIGRSQAVAVATGSRVPQGADAVVMVEYTAEDQEANRVKVFKEIDCGKNVANKGEDIGKDKVILGRGTWLRPQDVGVIASVGVKTVKVYQKPKVAVFSTGSELVEPGSELKTEAVLYDSNRYMLSSMIREFGGETVDLGICKDDQSHILAALKKALENDVVVISGGSSVGERDFVPAVINSLGKPGVIVHGVAMRPGSPTALSIVEGKPIISAPGYPVASFLAFYTFGRPLLFRMLGTKGLPEAKVAAKMASGIKLQKGMRAFIRVKLKTVTDKKGTVSYLAEPVSASAASKLSTLTVSDALIIMEGKKQLIKGQKVEVLLLRPTGDTAP